MSPEPGRRVESIDIVRGLVMVLMALDHVRDFVSRAAMSFSPTDLTRTTTALFFTRWITHFCAPAFMFTAGLGAFLWLQRGGGREGEGGGGRTRPQLSKFLLTRGLWLILLELVVMRLAYNFDLSSSYPVFLLVLWVLGICMVVLAALIWIPVRWLALLSVAVIALHNRLDPVRAADFGAAAGVWNLIHQVGAFSISGTIVIVGYPLVPWIAVMALGFCFGRLFLMDRLARRKTFVLIGAAATVGFVILRAVNGYGDPARWSSQPSAGFTLLSFLNTSKYPPSLAFLLMTLGPTFLALAFFDRPFKPSNPLAVFGKVPLFYFVLHFYLAHLAALGLALLRYGRPALDFMFQPVPSMGGPAAEFPPEFGYGLGVVFLVWTLVVVVLYPACRWFAGVKARRRDWWLSYL